MVLLTVLLLFFSSNVHAEYWGSSNSNYYGGRNTPAPIISIDLDPQEVLNSSFRIAARENRLKDMERFLGDGAQIDSTSDRGETALMIASRNCSPRVVDLLIREKANINLTDHKGRTALMYASIGTCVDVARLLLQVPGIRIKVKDDQGKMAADHARDNSVVEVNGPGYQIVQLIYAKSSPRGLRVRKTPPAPGPKQASSGYFEVES